MSELISGAARAGARVTAKQINRWRAEGLIPKPLPVSHGRGLGVSRVPPVDTLGQLLALVAILKEDRSLRYAAFRLWVDGYDVPISNVRRSLQDCVAQSVPSKAEFETGAERMAETIRRRPSAPKRAKDLAESGKLGNMLRSLGSIATERQLEPADMNEFADSFEAATGLDRARTDSGPDGVGPWLTSPITEDLFQSPNIFDAGPALDSATDKLMLAVRTAYRNYEKISAFAILAQKVLGSNVFGFAAFSESALGMRRSAHERLLFLAFLLFECHDKTALQKLNELGATADASLKQMQDAMAAATKAGFDPMTLTKGAPDLR